MAWMISGAILIHGGFWIGWPIFVIGAIIRFIDVVEGPGGPR